VDASEELLVKIADRLKAMADPMRLKILHVLQEGELCVNDILNEVGGSQANVSKHLSVLRRAGLVKCQRDGINVYYRIEDPAVFTICRTCCDAIEKQINVERKGLEKGRAAILGRKK
jgi:DNA-binding transcriptional ArsR family regulator